MKKKRRLTLWHPGGFSDFRKKISSFQLPYQRPSSSTDCARELFNGSNGSASLCTEDDIAMQEDDNSCYRNVCKMSVVLFALAIVFITLEQSSDLRF